MDLSWAAVIILPTLFTPAVFLTFLFRLAIPKSKAPPNRDYTSVLLFLILSALINLELIAFVADLIGRNQIMWLSPSLESTAKFNLFRDLVGRNDYQPMRPFVSIYSFLVNDFLRTNIFGIFIDLHLRPAIFCFFVFLANKTLAKIKKYLDGNYYEKFPSVYFNKAINTLLDPFKRHFFSYWNYVLDFDENLEILMLDILHDDDNLYSGMFVDWTPDDSESTDTVGSLGIKNIFRYEPAKGIIKPEDDSHFTSPKSERRWRLIQNDGVMYVPYSKIKTIHVWRFKKEASLNIWVTDNNSNERMKWYLLLFSKRPEFFSSVNVKSKVKNEEEMNRYEANFISWVHSIKLENYIDKINLEFFIEDQT